MRSPLTNKKGSPPNISKVKIPITKKREVCIGQVKVDNYLI